MPARLAIALLPAVLAAGCAGGPLGLDNQVIVHLDGDPSDVTGAQEVADAACARRGGRARFIGFVPSGGGGINEDESFRSPDAVFICDARR